MWSGSVSVSCPYVHSRGGVQREGGVEVGSEMHILGLVRGTARESKERVDVLVNGLSQLTGVGLLAEGVELLFAFRGEGFGGAESVIGGLSVIVTCGGHGGC